MQRAGWLAILHAHPTMTKALMTISIKANVNIKVVMCSTGCGGTCQTPPTWAPEWLTRLWWGSS